MARKVFLIGIGGTGMRCLESFVHTCAIGMYDETEVEMLALDTDSGNGNFKRLRNLISSYNALNGGNVKKDTFFSTKITYYEFSPGYTDGHSFDSISNYSSAASHRSESPTADLVDLFMDPDVRNMNLKHGYRAQTQMGSVLMYHAIVKAAYEAKNGIKSPARNDLREFLAALNSSALKQPVFVFGSVFGGTGASSIPIIPLAFKKATEILGVGKNVIGDNHFGTIVLTNYFNFMVDQQNNREVVAKSENFAINSQAALMFYNEDQTVNATYKRMYLLGRSSSEDRKLSVNGHKGVTGGEAQENPADYIELLAAFAAYDFFKEADKGQDAFKDDSDRFFCISHDYGTSKLDFPLFGQSDSEVLKKKMGVAVAASLLDVAYDFFYNVAKPSNIFVNVDVDSEQFKNLKKYWGFFNLAVNPDSTLSYGWLPQMYLGRGGEGIFFKDLMYQCTDLKSLRKFQFNKELYAGDNPPQFSVPFLKDRFDVAKSTFNDVKPELKTTMDDLLARTYATLLKLYFNE